MYNEMAGLKNEQNSFSTSTPPPLNASMDGEFGEMKKTDTLSKRWRVGRYAQEKFCSTEICVGD